MLLAVGRELDFLDGLVVGLLLGELEASASIMKRLKPRPKMTVFSSGETLAQRGPLVRRLVIFEKGELRRTPRSYSK